MKRRLFIRAAAVLSPAIAGCAGGGDGPSPAARTTESPAQTPTQTPNPTPVSARERYPDYKWDKLAGAEVVPSSEIKMSGFEFHPLVAAVRPGTDVTVTNEDSTAHTFTAPWLGLDRGLGGGERFSFTVEEAGTYDYVCTLHPPGMLGGLVVSETTPAGTATASPTATETPAPTETATANAPDQALIEATGDNEFVPARVSVAPGGTVTWENTSTGYYDDHTVTSARFHDKAKQWSMDERFSGGDKLSHTFDAAGVYEYYCTIHGQDTMCGAVLVGDVSLDKSLPCE